MTRTTPTVSRNAVFNEGIEAAAKACQEYRHACHRDASEVVSAAQPSLERSLRDYAAGAFACANKIRALRLPVQNEKDES